jgi:hypothetical protein
MIDKVRAVLRQKAEQSKPDGFVMVRPLDMLAMLDELDDFDALRAFIANWQRTVKCPKCGERLY